MVFLTRTHAVSVVRLIGDSKLVIGVDVSVAFCQPCDRLATFPRTSQLVKYNN